MSSDQSYNIKTPTFVVNNERVVQNIQKMLQKARRSNTTLRPHFKTHQSQEVAKLFQQEGINQCTVSSVSMAKYFADNGWKDITIAFPVNLHEIDEINTLAEQVDLKIITDNAIIIQQLGQEIKHPLSIWIEIDCGYHRSGILWSKKEEIKSLIQEINGQNQLKFQGFLTHAGDTYTCRNEQEIAAKMEQTQARLFTLKEEFPKAKLSFGDTPSCSVVEDLSAFDEIRPGNFTFYDVMQVQIGSCDFNQIAASMYCPVVGIYPDRGEAVIYGGGVHFSKEVIHDSENNKIFGVIHQINDVAIKPSLKSNVITSLSQEHGIVKLEEQYLKNIKIGDCLMIYPIHSCLTANLMK
ncbi:alanine racemase [Puteibacter caeruleilacunae]|nr:alanine racemase [Puteibacter caeruleilacunae]